MEPRQHQLPTRTGKPISGKHPGGMRNQWKSKPHKQKRDASSTPPTPSSHTMDALSCKYLTPLLLLSYGNPTPDTNTTDQNLSLRSWINESWDSQRLPNGSPY